MGTGRLIFVATLYIALARGVVNALPSRIEKGDGGCSDGEDTYATTTTSTSQQQVYRAEVGGTTPQRVGYAARGGALAGGGPDSPTIDVYLMSRCPSGADGVAKLLQALQSLQLAARNADVALDIRLNLHFIGHYLVNNETGQASLASMHGNKEVYGDMWEACAAKALRVYPPTVLLQFLVCINRDQDNLPNEKQMRTCSSTTPGLNYTDLHRCVKENEGAMILKAEFIETKRLGIHTSPTILINSVRLQHRYPQWVINALCRVLTPDTATTLPLCHRQQFSVS